MTTQKRIKILTKSEVQKLYSPPLLTANDQRFFFALDERERLICKRVRQRRTRCMLALLLGYFKAKPVVLTPRYHRLKIDLKYISQDVFPGTGFAPFTLDRKEKDRIYNRIFKLTGYQGWSSNAHLPSLLDYLSGQAQAWLAPRHLFDSTIEYLSQHKIEIVKQASPVAWYNINLKGTYNFELSDDLPNLEEMMSSIDGYLPV